MVVGGLWLVLAGAATVLLAAASRSRATLIRAVIILLLANTTMVLAGGGSVVPAVLPTFAVGLSLIGLGYLRSRGDPEDFRRD